MLARVGCSLKGRPMKTERDLSAAIEALPAFPVVLVTVDRNIMTAAAFGFYSFKPPCVMVGIRPENLTFDLISAKREFGINLPSREQIDVARVCGSVSGRTVDKFSAAGLTPQKGKVIESYLIAECPVSLECRVVHEIQFGGSHRWFIGEIQAVQIDEHYTREQALMYWMLEYRAVGEILLKVKRQ
jgi:flavin reductase (DIM6/NTAB) family NADH-FMN oxidoreductase RutF